MKSVREHEQRQSREGSAKLTVVIRSTGDSGSSQGRQSALGVGPGRGCGQVRTAEPRKSQQAEGVSQGNIGVG